MTSFVYVLCSVFMTFAFSAPWSPQKQWATVPHFWHLGSCFIYAINMLKRFISRNHLRFSFLLSVASGLWRWRLWRVNSIIRRRPSMKSNCWNVWVLSESDIISQALKRKSHFVALPLSFPYDFNGALDVIFDAILCLGIRSAILLFRDWGKIANSQVKKREISEQTALNFAWGNLLRRLLRSFG